MNVGKLLGSLPVFNGARDTIKQEQSTSDIVNEVLNAHAVFASDYDLISENFAINTPKKLFDFCKQNLPYKIESEYLQTTRSPAGILAMKQSDCKHYAGFIAGVLDSLNRKNLADFDWCYRFASYNILNKDAKHVFVVIKEKGGQELWIDPVLDYLDDRYPSPFYIKDKKPKSMALVRMSGVNRNNVSTSHNVVRKKDFFLSNTSCGCSRPSANGKLVAVSGFDLSTLIQQNPIPSLLVIGLAGYLIYKAF